MANFIKEKIIKTRVKHNCHGCGWLIQPKTENILSQTFVDDGIYTLYFCLECQSFLISFCSECKECFELESATEGFIAECRMECDK